ncbi:unnamed protein product [[Candida] boidinii]|nr:unnamed protein product [[Candida] boidinii]
MYNDIFKNVEVREKCYSDDDSVNKTFKAIEDDYDLIITKLRDLEEFKRRHNIENGDGDVDDNCDNDDHDTKSDSVTTEDAGNAKPAETRNDSFHSDEDSFDSDDGSDDLSICYQNLNHVLLPKYLENLSK